MSANQLAQSARKVKELISHELSAFDIDSVSDGSVYRLTAHYTLDLSKAFDYDKFQFNVQNRHPRVQDALEGLCNQILFIAEHDIIQEYPYLDRPVHRATLIENGQIEELMSLERLLKEELKTTSLNITVRISIEENLEKSTASLFGKFQYEVNILKEGQAEATRVLLKTELMPIVSAEHAEKLAKEFLQNCRS